MRLTVHCYAGAGRIGASLLLLAVAAAGQTGSAPVISLSSSRLLFTVNSPPQPITITNTGGGTLAWSAVSGAPWIALLTVPAPPQTSYGLHASGAAPSTLNVAVNSVELPVPFQPGEAITGTVTITAAGATNSPQTVFVTVTLPGEQTPPSPPPILSSIQNSASYSNSIAQGSIFVVTGAALGPTQLTQAPANSLPLQLAGTSVQVVMGGAIVACPIAYTSATQIAAVLPSTTALGPGTLTVTFNGQTSYPVQINVVSHGVGIYTVASSGIGSGIITGLDYVTKTMAQPAKVGETVIAWATGLGPIAGNDAVVAPSPLFTNVEVLVGNQPATVVAAGRSGCCAGLDQIAFTVPSAPLGCYVPVSIRVAGGPVNAGGSVSNFVTLPLSQNGEPCSNQAPTLPPAVVSKAASGQSMALGLLAVGPGPVLHRVAPSVQAMSLGSAILFAGKLSKALRVAVPEADAAGLLDAYESGDEAAVRRILTRYARALKNNSAAAKLLRAAAQLSQEQAAAGAFVLGSGSGVAFVAPEFVSDIPPAGTCTILQNTPYGPSANTHGLDAGSALTITGPAGKNVMAQVSPGQYSVVLGTGASTTDTTPGFYTVAGTGGQNVGAFSVSLNVANPLDLDQQERDHRP